MLTSGRESGADEFINGGADGPSSWHSTVIVYHRVKPDTMATSMTQAQAIGAKRATKSIRTDMKSVVVTIYPGSSVTLIDACLIRLIVWLLKTVPRVSELTPSCT